MREALQLFLDDLLQDVAIEREVGDELFQFAVFVAATGACGAPAYQRRQTASSSDKTSARSR